MGNQGKSSLFCSTCIHNLRVIHDPYPSTWRKLCPRRTEEVVGRDQMVGTGRVLTSTLKSFTCLCNQSFCYLFWTDGRLITNGPRPSTPSYLYIQYYTFQHQYTPFIQIFRLHIILLISIIIAYDL